MHKIQIMQRVFVAAATFSFCSFSWMSGIARADSDESWDWEVYEFGDYGYQPNRGAPGISGEETSPTSTATTEEVTRGALNHEIVSLTPQVGVLTFTNQLNSAASRAAYGFGADMNLIPIIDKSLSNFYGGISSGLLYSHMGDASSGFFGTTPSTVQGTGGANLYVIPANLKVGYHIMDNLRVAAHGGGNILYRSVASAMNLDPASTLPGSAWNIYPNVGADLEYGINKNVAITLRPDWTFGSGNSFFLGTIGLGIGLG